MNSIKNQIKQLKSRNLIRVDNILQSLSEERDDVISLRNLIDSKKIPEKFLKTNLGVELFNLTTQVSVEIESWVSVHNNIVSIIEMYRREAIRTREMLKIFLGVIKLKRITRKFDKFERRTLEIRDKLEKKPASFFTDQKESFENRANPKIYNISLFIWLKVTTFLYSPKNVREVFEPIVADWQEEYFKALSNNEIWKAHWIKIRYTYAFVIAMWQKSPLGDLLEMVKKIVN